MPNIALKSYSSDAAAVVELPGHQGPNLKLQFVPAAFVLPAPETDKFIQANFTDSVAGAGPVLHDKDSATIGWFVESAQLCAWLQTDAAVVDVHRRLREAEIHAFSPLSQNGSGSTSNSCSVSFGGNLGTFAGEPMGGVSIGVSSTKASSETYADFSFGSNNEPGLLRHTWSLTMQGYDSAQPARSLWTGNGPPFAPVSTWWKALPTMAVGDIGFSSYVIFKVPPSLQTAKVFLCASLAAQYVYLDAPPSIGNDPGKARKELRMASHAVAFDMSQVTL